MFKTLFIQSMVWGLTGSPIQSWLAEATSISRKTWDAGGPKRPAALKRAEIEVDQFGIEKMLGKGISKEEINSWLSSFPKATDEEPFCLSTLVQVFSLHPDHFPETMALAERMDKLAHELHRFRGESNFSAFKQTLQDPSRLPARFFADTDQELISEGIPSALCQLQTANDWEELDNIVKVVMDNIIFSLMACWDIEFCRTWFPGMKPFPLFEILMPHLSEPSQANLKVSRGMIRHPIKNLLDIVAALGDRQRNPAQKQLNKIRVKEMEKWLQLGEPQILAQKLWNWRSGRDAFLLEDFDVVWRRFAGAYDDQEKCRKLPTAPFPLFFASILWDHLLVRTNGENHIKELYLFQPRYLMWWERHFSHWMTKEVAWGDHPWPRWINDQSSWSGAKSPDSSLSSQSSGRSSKSRDSQ